MIGTKLIKKNMSNFRPDFLLIYYVVYQCCSNMTTCSGLVLKHKSLWRIKKKSENIDIGQS